MMNDIFDDLAAVRPNDLEAAVPGWSTRREQLLHELDARAASATDDGTDGGKASTAGRDRGAGTHRSDKDGRHRRWLLVAAAAAAVALVVIVGAAVQTGQRVQPEPAQTVSAPPLDPDQPVHQIGPGQYFLRRTSTATKLFDSAAFLQSARWFDHQGTMWSDAEEEPGQSTKQTAVPAEAPSNPLSYLRTLPADPAAAAKVLTAATKDSIVNSVQAAAEANPTPNQLRTLRNVLLLQKDAEQLPDGLDGLSRPATIVQTPGGMHGTTARFYFAADTGELLELRLYYPGQVSDATELARSTSTSEVRDSEPVPPFEPVVAYSVPATVPMSRPIGNGQYLRRSVTARTGKGVTTNGNQWVDAAQNRWLHTGEGLSGPQSLPTPAGLTAEQYLAAMPGATGIEAWLRQGISKSCDECWLARADALMLGNLDRTQRGLVIAAIARQPNVTDRPRSDGLGRSARVLEVSVMVGKGQALRSYAYDPLSLDLLEWSADDPGAPSNGVVKLTFTGSEVTDQPPA